MYHHRMHWLKRFLFKIYSEINVFQDICTIIRYYKFGQVDILFYCINPINHIWIQETFEEAERRNLKVALLISNAVDKPKKHNVFYGSRLILKLLRTKIFVSASSNLQKFWMPYSAKWLVHIPHSFVSLHAIYPNYSFDGYNLIFACGPHHVREVEELNKYRKIKNRTAEIVGYSKLDVLQKQYKNYQPSPRSKKLVVLAPSWGEQNILHANGLAIISEFLKNNIQVIIRPHPHFFNSNDKILQDIENKFGDKIQIENSSSNNESIFEADLLISDYSGISFEFVFLRKLPVLFIDVPKKIKNKDWQQINAEPIEFSRRQEIGKIVANDEHEIVNAANELLNNKENYQEKIEYFIQNNSYNIGNYAKVATNKLQGLLA